MVTNTDPHRPEPVASDAQTVATPKRFLGGRALADESLLRTLEEETALERVRWLALGRALESMLYIALDLGLFAKIRGKSVTLEELAELVGLPRVSLRSMAQLLCKEGLLTYQDGKLTNHPVVDKYLATDSLIRQEVLSLRHYLWPVEELYARLMTPLEQPVYQGFTDEEFYYDGHPARIAWGEQLTLIYDFRPHRVLLDVASSSGGYCIGIRKHYPHLRCMLFDLPRTEPFAEEAIADAGMTDFISFNGGSFLTDKLPRGADVGLISNTLQDWPPEGVVQILRKIHDALEPDGTILVHQEFFEDDWSGSTRAVFHAFLLGRDGWQPAYGEMEPLMTAAGFVDLERRRNLLIGRKTA